MTGNIQRAAQPVTPFYPHDRSYDDMFDANGSVRPHYAPLHESMSKLSGAELADLQRTLEQSFLLQGITFTVYGAGEATERIIPTDLFPRILPAGEWTQIETGLIQRLRALNAFLADVYGDQMIIADGVVPRDLILGAPSYRREMQGVYVPHQSYVNVSGADLIRGQDGTFFVLEDNLRVPSGVSYMLANREAAKRTFPETFRNAGVRPVERYPDLLLATLKSLAPEWRPDPQIVVLVLRMACALEPYLRVYTAELEPRHILEFLVFDEEFPRSIRFSIRRMEDHLTNLGRPIGSKERSLPERLAARLSGRLEFADLEKTSAPGALLGAVARECTSIHDAIYETFVRYPLQQRLLA